MARVIEVAVPAAHTEDLARRLADHPGLIGVEVQRGVSRLPAGDIVTFRTTNEASFDVLRVLEEIGVLDGGSFTIDEPVALVAAAKRVELATENNEAPWEEMESLLRRDTNLGFNFLALMFLSGGIAGVGLVTDTLHVVIGAMLVAPGFEPLVRIAFGPPARQLRESIRGLKSAVAGYLVLALGAAVAGLATLAVLPSRPDLHALHWIGYWTDLTWQGVILGLLAGLAGTTVINSHRTVFSAGVMVALALIPSMAIVGLGLATGEFALAGLGALRWLVDVGCVLVAAEALMILKFAGYHRRRSLY